MRVSEWIVLGGKFKMRRWRLAFLSKEMEETNDSFEKIINSKFKFFGQLAAMSDGARFEVRLREAAGCQTKMAVGCVYCVVGTIDAGRLHLSYPKIFL